MKTSITLILLGISIIFMAITNFSQTVQLYEQGSKIKCLEQGRIYVGDSFCAEKP